MQKFAIAIVLADFSRAAGSTSASAMQVVPLSGSVLSNLSGDVIDTWCWRDRWGRVRCR